MQLPEGSLKARCVGCVAPQRTRFQNFKGSLKRRLPFWLR
ncbi:hypothetical protein HMPREF9120_02186 [Neisseria sp. oral taxon 020 str. F0370]|nr:hypothetical protein HMPREF9120_02186 [Neisseria sp. oral taxon 020 str. F0370]